MEQYSCIICGKSMPDFEPQMCCSGFDCGCRGLPVEPPICSEECFNKLGESNEEREKHQIHLN